MSSHGPDAPTFDKASEIDTSAPQKVDNTMAFMVETRDVIAPTAYALGSTQLQPDYYQCGQGFKKFFDGKQA